MQDQKRFLKGDQFEKYLFQTIWHDLLPLMRVYAKITNLVIIRDHPFNLKGGGGYGFEGEIFF